MGVNGAFSNRVNDWWCDVGRSESVEASVDRLTDVLAAMSGDICEAIWEGAGDGAPDPRGEVFRERDNFERERDEARAEVEQLKAEVERLGPQGE